MSTTLPFECCKYVWLFRLYIVHTPPRLSCRRPPLRTLYLSVTPSCHAIVHQPFLMITLHDILWRLNWHIAFVDARAAWGSEAMHTNVTIDIIRVKPIFFSIFCYLTVPTLANGVIIFYPQRGQSTAERPHSPNLFRYPSPDKTFTSSQGGVF